MWGRSGGFLVIDQVRPDYRLYGTLEDPFGDQLLPGGCIQSPD